MVAYNFHRTFANQVEELIKRHTIRAHRKRHARPDEPVQLYTGMRHRNCRKLVDPDPICSQVQLIEIRFEKQISGLPWITSIELDGRSLTDSEIELLARRDGFDPARISYQPPRAKEPICLSGRGLMSCWWRDVTYFEGVVIHWAPEIGSEE